MNVSSPELTIVVGASEGQPDPTGCLVALCAQSRGRAVEILFVGNAGHPALAVARRFEPVTVIESDRRRLVPELWGLGVSRARGAIVAITISGCLPGPRWVEGLIREHQRPDAAIGGAIEQAEPAGLTDWAVFFVRYAVLHGALRCRSGSRGAGRQRFLQARQPRQRHGGDPPDRLLGNAHQRASSSAGAVAAHGAGPPGLAHALVRLLGVQPPALRSRPAVRPRTGRRPGASGRAHPGGRGAAQPGGDDRAVVPARTSSAGSTWARCCWCCR